jgi:endonuclease YncB( thermonuclease family)
MKQLLLSVILVAATLGACEAAVQVTGPATIVDGDSLEIGATSIRLFGIDAPEAAQNCGRGGTSWPCGTAAMRKLGELIATRSLVCTQRDIDDYGRMVAVCRRGGTDVGAEMVRAGLALAYRRYGDDYIDEEAQARGARRGVWNGEFTPPWEWRRNKAPSPRATATPIEAISPPRTGCRIKGNINRANERIYHLPGSPSYEETRIDERYGERWFCSEAEARAAGWRAPL